MSVNQNAKLEITAFDWVPDFARGYVRDLRPRWACEEIGLDYAEHLISAINRPADHFLFQPWGQVPVLNDGGIRLFESGAILLHLAEKDARLMPRDPQARANTLAWLFAAYNSVEPMLFELGNVDIFSTEEEWAKLRRPSLIEFIQGRLGRLNDAIGDKQYLTGEFSVADIAMATVLREGVEAGLIAEQPRLQAYLDRCLARPAFQRAMDAQLAAFSEENGPPA
ncbi:glutathione S-transferase [Sphingopyxis sp. Root214]|uniref:glutathione S-transferase family protein n=1 Tax=unclassified Sphingopyxis TaxID=2614943 RepID=UPI000700E6FE|nr:MULTISPECIES: glutathione S-transferase family protein [unclassified Sphingopyxis]KQZ73622.1 glutathione S-transferase [Sphingopyxis sp. Root154]KRC07764.1 glutathione S-transferase [Sphingopyxis sp. Root214]